MITSCERSCIQLVIAGHVDHGKSTLVGRLLADTGSLPDGKLDQVRALCERTAKPFEYAFLLDALKHERAQGITIDAARGFFKTATRRYIVIDAPGHIEFLRNMITGAARADAALLVIGAHEGIQENSRRHATILSMLGIHQLAVVVNKMDLANYRRRTFDAIVKAFGTFLEKLGITARTWIPAAARAGANVVTRAPEMPWFAGPTVLEAVEAFESERPAVDRPFRMPVQDVYKFTNLGDDRRIIAGTVEGGRAHIGDELVFYPSGKRARAVTVEAFNERPRHGVSAGQAVGLTVSPQVYATRGQLVARADEPAPHVTSRIRTSLFWLGQEPLTTDRDLLFKLGTARVPVRVETIHRVMDASNLGDTGESARVERHQVADCTLKLGRTVAFDLAADLAATGRFVLVDADDIRGGGIISAALPDRAGPPRSQVLAPPPAAVVWFTGLPGPSKTTIARAVKERLCRLGGATELLDGEEIRAVFPATGFSRAARDELIRRVGHLASRLGHHGVTCLVSLGLPFLQSRDFARSLCRRFIEVHVMTPVKVYKKRDPRSPYRQARADNVQTLVVADPYASPSSPELTIDTATMTVDAAVDLVIDRMLL